MATFSRERTKKPFITGKRQCSLLVWFSVLIVLASCFSALRTRLPFAYWPSDSLELINHPTTSKHADRDHLCQSNPYLGALNGSLTDTVGRMEQWLQDLPRYQQRAAQAAMHKHTHERFFAFDETIAANCSSMQCVGGPCRRDTSKIVCGLELLNADQEACIVYSIGGNDHWEFELDVLARTPCQVHTFDCTGPVTRFTKPPNDRLHFHHVCLGTLFEEAPPAKACRAKGKCGETWTLLQMQQQLRHNRIDLFKIDIEGFEWDLLESWPQLGDAAAETIVLPYQILLEVHYQTQFGALRPPDVARMQDFRTPRDLVNLHAHFLRMGYVVVQRDDNRACLHCTELTLLRTKCPAKLSSAPSLPASLGAQTHLLPKTTEPETIFTKTAVSDSEADFDPKHAEIARKLKDMGLEPIYNPDSVAAADPWKMKLFQRLDRIRVACGELCNVNTVQALEQHSVFPQGDNEDSAQKPPSSAVSTTGALPMILVPNVNCPALLLEDAIDSGDTTAPAIPPELLSYFTIGKAYAVGGSAQRRRDIFLGNQSDTSLWPTGNLWKQSDIDETVRLIGLGKIKKATYTVEGTNMVRDKLREVDMKGKSVLIIGSSHPWLECICLFHGAAKVTTLEYGQLTSEHPQIVAMTPDVFRAQYLAGTLELFDGVLSHSSVEHSGLGRYGDALNPWGDILAVARAWCVTKPDGFLYIGVPTGQDLIFSNWHRIYGRIRWPLLTANWRRIEGDEGGDELDRRAEVAVRWKDVRAGGWGYIFRKYDAAATLSQ